MPNRSLPVFGGLDAGPRPGAREQVRDALAAGVGVVDVVGRVAASLDAVVARWLALEVPGEGRPACARGCSHCCHERVEATAPEVFLLARYLRAHPDAERDRRIEARTRATEGLDRRARRLAQLPCPLLEEGACAAYPARPLACRRAHSTDASACAAVHADPAVEEPRIPAAPSLQWNASSLVLGWLEGAIAAGWAMHHYELNAALRLAMADARAEERFGAGDDPLAPAMTVPAADLPRLLGG